jgi:hypothetical protein
MTELMKPCNNCGVGVPSDVWAEELGFCVPCQHEYFEHAETGACGHFVRVCPNGGGDPFACEPFCVLCEGSGDFCRICWEQKGFVLAPCANNCGQMFSSGVLCSLCDVGGVVS